MQHHLHITTFDAFICLIHFEIRLKTSASSALEKQVAVDRANSSLTQGPSFTG
jgi:hypothetical protein